MEQIKDKIIFGSFLMVEQKPHDLSLSPKMFRKSFFVNFTTSKEGLIDWSSQKIVHEDPDDLSNFLNGEAW